MTPAAISPNLAATLYAANSDGAHFKSLFADTPWDCHHLDIFDGSDSQGQQPTLRICRIMILVVISTADMQPMARMPDHGAADQATMNRILFCSRSRRSQRCLAAISSAFDDPWESPIGPHAVDAARILVSLPTWPERAVEDVEIRALIWDDSRRHWQYRDGIASETTTNLTAMRPFSDNSVHTSPRRQPFTHGPRLPL
jgi:hypothetical protein